VGDVDAVVVGAAVGIVGVVPVAVAVGAVGSGGGVAEPFDSPPHAERVIAAVRTAAPIAALRSVEAAQNGQRVSFSASFTWRLHCAQGTSMARGYQLPVEKAFVDASSCSRTRTRWPSAYFFSVMFGCDE